MNLEEAIENRKRCLEYLERINVKYPEETTENIEANRFALACMMMVKHMMEDEKQ